MIYWIIFFFLFIVVIFNESELPFALRYLFLAVFTLMLTLLAGLRGNIEPDYANYREIFEYGDVYLKKGGGDVEYGYLVLNSFFRNIGLGFQAIIFFMAILSVVPKAYFFYRYSPNYLFSLLIYFATIYFIFDFIAIRQAVTLAIFMWSLVFVFKKRFFPFLICIALGSLIHLSIILLLPGYFIFNRKFSNNLLYLLVGICTIINVLQIKIGLMGLILEKFVLPDSASGKVEIYALDQTFSFVSLKQIGLALVFVFLNSKKRDQIPLMNMLTNIFVTGIIMATILNGIPQLSYRIKWYFLWPEAILMIYFIEYLSFKKLSLKVLMYSLLAILYATTMSGLLNDVASRGSFIYPYRTFFE